jgi:hypothetical protein
MRVNFLVDFDLIIEELKDFEQVKKVLKYPYYFYKTFPQLENNSTEEILNYFEKNREEIIKKLEERKLYIEKIWIPTNSKFFRETAKLTNFDWKFKIYECLLSCAWSGRYFFENKVEIFAFLRDEDIVNILAEELFHLHYWNYLEKKMNIKIDFIRKKEMLEYSESEKNLWMLSEVVIGFVLPEIGLYLNSEWFTPWWEADPKMGRLYKKLCLFWKSRKSFESFLRQSIKIADSFEKSNPRKISK